MLCSITVGYYLEHISFDRRVGYTGASPFRLQLRSAAVHRLDLYGHVTLVVVIFNNFLFHVETYILWSRVA